MSARDITLLCFVLAFMLLGCAFVREGLTQRSDDYCNQHPDAPPSKCWGRDGQGKS
jgi:hypothetical protein